MMVARAWEITRITPRYGCILSAINGRRTLRYRLSTRNSGFMNTDCNTHCSRCQAPMTCNPGACWCEKFPPLPKPDAAMGCYCESCLTSALEESGRDHSTAVKGRSP
jgi:hypothetical protein